HSRVPVVVGFGISTPEQVAMLKDACDGVVVGSALVQKIEQLLERLQTSEEKNAAIAEFASYARSLAAPLREPCSSR
ncbi:tryptophan synthase subunit alpha, partial [Geobacillus thermodenitrificans]